MKSNFLLMAIKNDKSDVFAHTKFIRPWLCLTLQSIKIQAGPLTPCYPTVVPHNDVLMTGRTTLLYK